MMMKATAQNNGALSERKRKRLKKRVEKSLSNLRSDRKNYRLYIELGDLYTLLEQAQEADEYYSVAIDLLHEKQIDERMRKQIIMLYGKILNLVPEKRETYSALGNEYVAAGQKEKAARFLLSSAKRAFENGDYELALQCYTDVIEIGKSNPYIIERCTEIFLKLGRKDDAVKNYIHIGDTYAHEEKYIEALDYYKKADALQPENPELNLKIARMYYALDWTENAATELVKLAEYHEEHHNYPEAMKYYQHGLSLDQDNEKAMSGKQRISELHTVESPGKERETDQKAQQKDILDELDRLEDIIKEQGEQRGLEGAAQEFVAPPSSQKETSMDSSLKDSHEDTNQAQVESHIIDVSELALEKSPPDPGGSESNGHEVLPSTEQSQPAIQQPNSKALEVSWQDRLMDLNLEKDFVFEAGLEEEQSALSRETGVEVHSEAAGEDTPDQLQISEEEPSGVEPVFSLDSDSKEDAGGDAPEADIIFSLDSGNGQPEEVTSEKDYSEYETVGFDSGTSIDTGWIGENAESDHPDVDLTKAERAFLEETPGKLPIVGETERFVEEIVLSAETPFELESPVVNETEVPESQPVQSLENVPFEPEQIAIEEFSELEREAEFIGEEPGDEPIVSDTEEMFSPEESTGARDTEEPDTEPGESEMLRDAEEVDAEPEEATVLMGVKEPDTGEQPIETKEEPALDIRDVGNEIVFRQLQQIDAVQEENPETEESFDAAGSLAIEIAPADRDRQAVVPDALGHDLQNQTPEVAEKLEDLEKQIENTKEEKYFLQEQFTAQIGELRSREASMRREFEAAKKEKEDLKLRLDEMTATYEVSRHHAEEFDETRYEAIVSKIQNKKLALQQHLNRLMERREENGRFMAAELQHLGETKQRLQHNLEYIQQVKTRIEEKVNTELREAQHQIRALTQSSQKLEDQVETQKRAESNLQKQLAIVKDERDALQDQFTETITALTADNETLGEQVKELTTEHSKTEKTLKKKFQTLHVSYQRLKSEYRNSLESKETELNRTAQRLSEFADEYVKLEKTLGEIRQERDKLGKMLAKETATRERLEEKLINIESQVDSLEVQGTELLEQLGEELDRQLSLKQSTSDEFQVSLEDFEQLLSLQEREIQSLEAL